MAAASRCIPSLTASLVLAGAASAESRPTSTEAPELRSVQADGFEDIGDLPEPGSPSPFGEGCDRVVGLVRDHGYRVQLQSFLEDNGLTVLLFDEASIASGVLVSVDALLLSRAGLSLPPAAAVEFDAWVRAGGTLVTELMSTELLYEPGPLHSLEGEIVESFALPSGVVCGGNTIVVNEPWHELAQDLPADLGLLGRPSGRLRGA